MIDAVNVFFMLFFLDIIWAKCVQTVHSGVPYEAAVWATAFFLGNTLVVLDIVGARWLLVPAAAGAFVGTYFIVWYNRRKK